MKKIFLLYFVFTLIIFAQSEDGKTKWEPFNWMIGRWEGKGTGKFGDSSVEREYEYLMGGTFIIGKNNSFYEKQEKNPKGEIHNHWDIFSYDKIRKKYVLRQFHAEDITNTFIMDSTDTTGGAFVFVSEAIENFKPGWGAKEAYKIINNNEFVEIFYLAPPGKDYTEYIRTTFKRAE